MRNFSSCGAAATVLAQKLIFVAFNNDPKLLDCKIKKIPFRNDPPCNRARGRRFVKKLKQPP